MSYAQRYYSKNKQAILLAQKRKYWSKVKQRHYTVYTITDTESGSIVYVGKTTLDLRSRAIKHCNRARITQSRTFYAFLAGAGCLTIEDFDQRFVISAVATLSDSVIADDLETETIRRNKSTVMNDRKLLAKTTLEKQIAKLDKKIELLSKKIAKLEGKLSCNA